MYLKFFPLLKEGVGEELIVLRVYFTTSKITDLFFNNVTCDF